MMVSVRSAGAGLRLPALLFAVAAAIAGLIHAPAGAHELRPAIAAASIERSGAIELRISLNLEAYTAGIGAQHSNTAQSDRAPHRPRRSAPSSCLSRRSLPAVWVWRSTAPIPN